MGGDKPESTMSSSSRSTLETTSRTSTCLRSDCGNPDGYLFLKSRIFTPCFGAALLCFWQIAGFLGVLWCLSILSCLYSEYIYVPMQINPLILYGFMMLFLINPFKTCYYKSRFWLLKLLVSPITPSTASLTWSLTVTDGSAESAGG